MKTRTLHRALSMLLTAAMVLNMGLTPVFAAEGVTPPGVSGVCTHHTEHTEDCGYKQGTPCTHEHTEDCYTKELTCTLTEGDTAGEAPEIATDSEATLDSGNAPAGEAHTHGEDCYTKTDNCKHEHKVNGGEADREGPLGGDEACGLPPTALADLMRQAVPSASLPTSQSKRSASACLWTAANWYMARTARSSTPLPN